jgi:hypothetical protein
MDDLATDEDPTTTWYFWHLDLCSKGLITTVFTTYL